MSLKRPVAFDHTHENVTTTYDGFMDHNDKSILNNLYDNLSGVYLDKDRLTFNVSFTDGTTANLPSELWYSEGKATEAISNGDNVMIAGSQGDHYLVKKAVASEINAKPHLYLGVATKDIAINEWCKITKWGLVNNIDMNSWAYGTELYFNPATNGFTSTLPSLPNARIKIGMVVKTGPNGILLVDVIDQTLYTNPEIDANFVKRMDILVTDFNAIDPTTLTQGRIYSVNTGFQPLNRPTSENFFSGFLIVHNAGGNLATLFLQSTGYGMYMRYFNGTVWGDFYRIWTQNTDGTGSGLDADTLDGNHGTYYQQALVSGTNIKTVNSNSLLGSGDLAITASVPDPLTLGRIRLTDTTDASLTSTNHAFQNGATNSTNIIMDGNEIMARNNSVKSDLNLQVQGGNLNVLNDKTYADGDDIKIYLNRICDKGLSGGVNYTKYYDGTVIMWATITTSSIACSTLMGAGGGYRTASQTLNLPVTLAVTSSASIVVTPGDSTFYNISGGGYINTLSQVVWWLCSVSSDATTRARKGTIQIIGRWY